ncbi:MAG: hypothetical protein QW240_02395 [Candidatus Caldarchaeum sp.]
MILKPAVVVVDITGMGAPFSEFLQKKLPPVMPVTITRAVKESLVKNLCSTVLERKLIIPAGETTLIKQLRHFEQTFKDGHVRYGAPVGEHYDYVMALTLAVYGANFMKPRADAAFFWRWTSPAHFPSQNK